VSEEQTWTQPLALAVDAGFAGVVWPVFDNYEVEERPGELGGPEPFIVRGSRRVSHWRPGVARIADEIADLSRAKDSAIVDWVSTNGWVGLAGEPEAEAESLPKIREMTQHLSQCRHTLERIRRGGSVVEMLSIVKLAAGHLVDVGHLEALSGFPAGRLADHDWASERAGADLQALYGLGVALMWPLERLTRLYARPAQRNDGFMRLEPAIYGRGPLAIAYLETLAEAARVYVSWETGAVREDWRGSRPCHRCGTLFHPKKIDSRWCSDRCRWAASKEGRRRTKRGGPQEDEE
jgi:hypothetical protein